MNCSQMYSCDIGLQGSRGKGFSKYRRVFRYVRWNKRVTGMNICTTSVCSYPSGFIGGRGLQSSGHQGLGETSESVFGIFWWNRRSSVSSGSPGGWDHENLVSELVKSFNPKRRGFRVPEYRRGVKDPNTTQLATWARKPHSQVSKIVFRNTRLNCGQGVGEGLPSGSWLWYQLVTPPT